MQCFAPSMVLNCDWYKKCTIYCPMWSSFLNKEFYFLLTVSKLAILKCNQCCIFLNYTRNSQVIKFKFHFNFQISFPAQNLKKPNTYTPFTCWVKALTHQNAIYNCMWPLQFFSSWMQPQQISVWELLIYATQLASTLYNFYILTHCFGMNTSQFKPNAFSCGRNI